jgi:hypothetical protein
MLSLYHGINFFVFFRVWVEDTAEEEVHCLDMDDRNGARLVPFSWIV